MGRHRRRVDRPRRVRRSPHYSWRSDRSGGSVLTGNSTRQQSLADKNTRNDAASSIAPNETQEHQADPVMITQTSGNSVANQRFLEYGSRDNGQTTRNARVSTQKSCNNPGPTKRLHFGVEKHDSSPSCFPINLLLRLNGAL